MEGKDIAWHPRVGTAGEGTAEHVRWTRPGSGLRAGTPSVEADPGALETGRETAAPAAEDEKF
jgi:hypothetical protein